MTGKLHFIDKNKLETNKFVSLQNLFFVSLRYDIGHKNITCILQVTDN